MQTRHREFLVSVDANKTPHSNRTLIEHLEGVYDLLVDWGAPEHVCLAGLFHSIYGTHAFKHQSTQDRDKVREMIGMRAEFLVDLFCKAKDRPLFSSIGNGEWRRELQEIEAANLLEQYGNIGALKKLVKEKLSDGARAAILYRMTER